MPPANAIDSGRSVSRTSRPALPGRSRATVAAGRGSTTRWPRSPSGTGRRRVELQPKRRRIVDREAANEPPADVGAGSTVQGATGGEEGDRGSRRGDRDRDDLVGPGASTRP